MKPEFKETVAKPIYSKVVEVLIDADSICYRAAHSGEKEYLKALIPKDHPLFKEMPTGRLFDYQKEIFDSMVAGIYYGVKNDLNLRGIDTSGYRLFFTPKKSIQEKYDLEPNFRYQLIDDYNYKAAKENLERGSLSEDDIFTPHPGYKSGRSGMKLPNGLNELFDYALHLDEAEFASGVEADDIVSYLKNKDPENVVLSVIDKDIYNGCPSGEIGHHNYGRREWVFNTPKDTELFMFRQALMGDSSDTIKGIFRYGVKAAERDLPEWNDHLWEDALAIFIEKGYTEDYAILMVRLVHMLQYNGEEIVLWSPPVLDEIIDGPGIQGTYDV